MVIFIDESGIHKQTDHSTFVLVYIEPKNYEELESNIVALEKKLGIAEFHWAHTVWKVKKEFMEEALRFEFIAKIAVVDNPVDPAQELERALLHMIVERDIRNIYIDGKKPKWYERKIKKILRDKGLPVRNLKTVNSSQYPGIRLADLVAGLTRAYFDDKNRQRIESYYKRLRKKTVVLIE